SKAEFFSAVIQHATSYEAVSLIPDYPKRPDVYYAHGEIPEPDPGHRFFNRLMDFFSPNDLASRLLIRAMFAAPICYRFAVHRPCWVIDSVDGAGVGKSTLPEMLSYLYDCKPVKTTKQELGYDYKELVKRLISTEGRNSRVLLVDNVTGDFRSSTFAELVTSWHISGKPPYGRGEESRPNNLTYCVTSNSASLDNDIASRSFIIYLKRPGTQSHWKRDVIGYINAHRFRIFADIIDILENHQPFDRAPVSRCPEFETEILQAMCGSEENYGMVCSAIAESRAETNIEEEQARQIEDEITAQLQGLGITPGEDKVFIRSDTLNLWMSGIHNAAKISIQDIRNYVKMGLLKQADKKVTRYPNDGRGSKGKLRRSGILWTGENVQGGEAFPVKIVGIKGDKSIGIIETVYPT
ncbi:MAG: AAA family ATPase, partial [Kiritimatiellaeota bacterium]|nr:AAA family ATPase [Kiritimatiellota bacterium]